MQEGVFLRKTNGKNTITPDGSDKPIFVAERNSMWALSGDRVRFSCMARRKNHIKEAQVIEILHRAKETFVGRISIDHDLATLISPSNVLANSIIIPRRKLKGAKEGDNVVVKIMEWPDADHRNMIGEVTDGGLCRARGLPRHVHVHHRPEGRQGLRRRAVHKEAEGRSLGGGRAYRRREPLR